MQCQASCNARSLIRHPVPTYATTRCGARVPFPVRRIDSNPRRDRRPRRRRIDRSRRPGGHVDDRRRRRHVDARRRSHSRFPDGQARDLVEQDVDRRLDAWDHYQCQRRVAGVRQPRRRLHVPRRLDVSHRNHASSRRVIRTGERGPARDAAFQRRQRIADIRNVDQLQRRRRGGGEGLQSHRLSADGPERHNPLGCGAARRQRGRRAQRRLHAASEAARLRRTARAWRAGPLVGAGRAVVRNRRRAGRVLRGIDVVGRLGADGRSVRREPLAGVRPRAHGHARA